MLVVFGEVDVEVRPALGGHEQSVVVDVCEAVAHEDNSDNADDESYDIYRRAVKHGSDDVDDVDEKDDDMQVFPASVGDEGDTREEYELEGLGEKVTYLGGVAEIRGYPRDDRDINADEGQKQEDGRGSRWLDGNVE